jgi:hypothetical protein
MMDYAEGGSVHDKLRAEGAKMGYAYGGTVKNTSAEFVQTRGKQDTMDNANFPPVNEASQRDKESGPRKPRRPRFKGGGGVRQVRAAEGGRIHIKTIERLPVKGDNSPDKTKGKGKSKKGRPKGVKARGGLMDYAEGGYAAGGVKKNEEAGSGIELTAARIRESAARTHALTAEARAAFRTTTATPRAQATATRSTLSNLDDPRLQVGTASASTEEAKAKAKPKPEPSIKQTGIGEHKEATFGRQMRPVMHVKLGAVGGPVTAAKGGRKKSRKVR